MDKNGIFTVAAIALLFLTNMLDTRITVALAAILLFIGAFVFSDKKMRWALAAAGGVIVAMFVVLATAKDLSSTELIIQIGIMLAIAGLVLYNRRKGNVQDERTIKISNTASSYAVWITYLAIAVCLWFNYSGLMKFEFQSFAVGILLVMLLSQAGVKAYLLKRGEE